MTRINSPGRAARRTFVAIATLGAAALLMACGGGDDQPCSTAQSFFVTVS